ncbi:NB-ARC domain containing protein, partial [Trema orientale]
LVSALIDQLVSIAFQGLDEEVRLVKDVDEDVRQLKSNLEAIQAVLEDAERRQLADQSVRNWLDRLKDVSFDMDNVLDEWSTAILKLKIEEEKGEEDIPTHHQTSEKVCFSIIPSPFSCFKSRANRIALRHDIAHKIKNLNQKLYRIAGEKDRFMLNTKTILEQPIERSKTTSFINETEIYGRDAETESLVSMLLSENSTTHQDKRLGIIPIVGMGGMGKTTLAQLVYNHDEVVAHFDERIWVCVSDPFEVINVAKAIVESIEGSTPNNSELDTLQQRIRKCIEGKRFLLVLDDVWTEDKLKWEQLKLPFKYGAVGSRILVTTRKKEVAIIVGAVNCMITLEKLSEEHCWSIFKQLAFSERKEEDCQRLEEIGREIARKAKGSPLISKTLGSLMLFKETQTQWKDVLDCELWESKDVSERIFAPFLLSYHDLSAQEKCCFTYCSIFPKDHLISRVQLIDMWMSQNYFGSDINSEIKGDECFETLVRRSFFQTSLHYNYDDSIRYCKMHDIVHDFAQFLTKDECINMDAGSVGEKLEPLNCKKSRHLTLGVGSSAVGYFSAGKDDTSTNEKNLRTLFIVPNRNDSIVDVSVLFSRLMFIRTLTLSRCGIKKLPESIGRLVHLRYLDLSYNEELEELPDALCGLCNMQTLNLSSCSLLRRLPEGLGKLVNLKHLYTHSCFSLEGLPKGIRSLTGIQKLDTLVIPRDKGTYFDIGDLKRLKNLQLRDTLCIKGCRNIENADEARKIDLKENDNIVALIIDFGMREERKKGFELDDIEILEALEPHQGLKMLEIDNYRGASLSCRPRWMMSLVNLRQIQLMDHKNCVSLPSFWKLPFLSLLRLAMMDAMKSLLGVEFFGITEETDKDDGGATKRDPPVLISFPKLESLSFNYMDQFEKWEGSATGTGTGLMMTIMPCLKHLEFKKCPRLHALPDLLQTTTSLRYLSISEAKIVEEHCQNRTGKEWDKISHVPNIAINNKIVRKDNIWIDEGNVNDADSIGTSSSAK